MIHSYPVDSQGHACGFNNAATGGGDLTSKPYLYFINPLDSDGGQVCVAACPTETKVTVAVADVICMDGVVPTLPTLLTLQDAGSCTTFIYESHPSVSRCVPSDVDALLSVANSDATSTYIQAAIDGKETAMLIIGDFARTWMWFLAFAGIALVVSFVWLVLMRYFTSFVVWVCALCVLRYVHFNVFTIFMSTGISPLPHRHS